MLLVDGNHLASRSRHAKSKHLSTSSGQASGVVYGFLSGLSWAKSQLRETTGNTIVFWDGGRSRKRMERYPGYKAGRYSATPTPEEVADTASYFAQIDSVRQALPMLGIRDCKVQHVEADDLISIYATMYARMGRHVVVFSGDKDLHQLACQNISIFDPQKELRNFEKLKEEWVLSNLEDIVKLKALSGDDSDAIKGVPKIGPVRAKQLLPFWSEIFSDEPLDFLTGALANYLRLAREHREVVQRNFDIIKLPRMWAESFYDLPEAMSAQQQLLVHPQRNTAAFIKFCQHWEMSTLIERLDQW